MNNRSLTLLGGVLLFVGGLPFLLMGLGMILSITSGCGEVITSGSDPSCQHNHTETGSRIANLMFAGIYVPISLPLGVVGAILLWISRKRRKHI